LRSSQSSIPSVLLSLSFFFLFLRLPPTPPLFPYPTLFRSHVVDADAGPADHLQPLAALDQIRRQLRCRADHDRVVPADDRGEVGDRKSTRLNSSHQIISYAVFCLKKKRSIIDERQSVRRRY